RPHQLAERQRQRPLHCRGPRRAVAAALVPHRPPPPERRPHRRRGDSLMVTMTERADTVPFISFNFSVEIDVPAIAPALCLAAFSECDGLEMTMDVKTIREGGNNTRQIRLIGAANYGVVTLKRGMTANFDLWDWFDAQQHGSPQQLRKDLRGETKITLLS